MTDRRIVIVGGVAGGATAAARAARMNPRANIIILEKGPAVSFANCGLPYHLGGEIERREKLLVASAEMFRKRFGVEVRTGHEVVRLDRATREVEVRPVDGNPPYREPYDQLILAPGAEPFVPPWGQDPAENLSTLWTLGDMDRILDQMRGSTIKHVTVVGAGFVGLEVAEQLNRIGRDVAVIERMPQVLPLMDWEMVQPIESELRGHGIDLRTEANVTQLRREGTRITGVALEDGSMIATDMVITAIGVRPRVGLARDAGLEIGPQGGIVVNDWMQTSDPNILAVGDAVEYRHGVLDQPSRVPLAGPANRAGRIAGSVAAGGESIPMAPVLGTAIVRVFERTAAMTGLSVAQLKRFGIEHRSVIIEAANHASYFPGAKPITLKLIYAPEDGRILGAQAIGYEGVDKRMDVIATTMRFRGTVEDLAGLDLAYAPPYGSAKDPVHQAAFVALNDLAGTPGICEFDADLGSYQVVDVREPAEIARQPLAGAINIPVDQLRARWRELDATKPTVIVCQSGKRAHIAACFLQGQGMREVRNLTGGMNIRGRLKKGVMAT